MKKLFTLLIFTFYSIFSVSAEITNKFTDLEELEAINTICTDYALLNQFDKLEDYLSKIDGNSEYKDKNNLTFDTSCIISVSRYSELTQQWLDKSPNNIYANIAKHLSTVNKFFKLRGIEFVGNTSSSQLETAYQFLNQSANEMEKIKPAKPSALWYFSRLRIAFFQGKEEYMNVFKVASQKFHNYIPIYAEMTTYMLPKWGYNYEEIDNYALYAKNNSPLKEEMYSSIYQRLINPCCSKEIIKANFFKNNIYKNGVYSTLKKYPTNYNYNRFAYASCLLEDYTTTKDLMKNIEVVILPLWKEKIYQTCLLKVNSHN